MDQVWEEIAALAGSNLDGIQQAALKEVAKASKEAAKATGVAK